MTDGREVAIGTDPTRPDTDWDGIWDGDELIIGESPTEPSKASAVIYVAPTGDDTNAGSKVFPKRSLKTLLPMLSGGELVLLEPGEHHPPGRDRQRRSATVEIVGVGADRRDVVVPGYEAWGATHVSLRRISMDRQVTITDDVLHSGELGASQDITLRDVDVTNPGGFCISIDRGVQRVAIENSHVHDCKVGIGGGNTGPDPRFDSHGITIVNNTLRSFTADGIQFGHWHDVLIEGNDIGHIADPAGLIHNDAIQLTGPDSRIVIRGNRLHHSQGQLLFMRTNFGPIDDVLVENNLVYDAGAVAVQSRAVTRARFVNNTIWNSGLNGLVLGGHPPDVAGATDTVVANNVLFWFSTAEGAQAAVFTNNVVRTTGTTPAGNVGVAVGANPGFVETATRDFRLALDSLMVGRGSPVFAPGTDLLGRQRSPTSPSVGAYE